MPASKSAVAAILPARWSSTRFPGKPLHVIAGKPLIQHVWERTLKAKAISRVIVATDDMRIAEAAFAFGAEVAITSSKHRSGTDRIAEVAKKLKGITHVLNVQGDEPLVDPALLNRLAKTLTADPKLDMITAANPFGPGDDVANPNAVKVVLRRDGDALYFSRSPIPFIRDAGVSVPFYRHQGIYGYSLRFLLQFVKWKPSLLEKAEQLEQLRALENGARIRVLITKHASVGVDTPGDVQAVEKILRKSAKSA
jgi:3-deoxy-manno-octulosonate cytidylyltransferase (CMP-KDO synthetase)